MKDFSVSMALVDYIPVIFFAVAAVVLMRDLYNKMSKGAFALFAATSSNVEFHQEALRLLVHNAIIPRFSQVVNGCR